MHKPFDTVSNTCQDKPGWAIFFFFLFFSSTSRERVSIGMGAPQFAAQPR